MWGQSCERCHEIAPTVAVWRSSSHRNVPCESCHGGSMQAANATRLALHLRGAVAEQIRLKADQVRDIVARCQSCHQREFADWKAGPHGSTYSRIFLDAKHNTKRLLMDDCLRCHGMFTEGGIRDVVAPVRKTGPWKMVRAEMANDPAVPCLACHSVHREGHPAGSGKKREPVAPSLALFDRRAMEPIGVAALPMPVVREGTRVVKISPDPRQALCYGCHAPEASAQLGSGDDRTPAGVHEGLSCLACHQKHGQDARASCATCHPRLSNCGRDVETMDTTFASRSSRHNIHTVKCSSCHPSGVPRKRSAVKGARASAGSKGSSLFAYESSPSAAPVR